MLRAIASAIFCCAIAVVSSTAGAVNLSGKITNLQGSPICGLVLANGQFTFSCSPTGTYALTGIPLDSAGQITLFAFADGHFPFKTTLNGAGGTYDISITAAPATPANDNRSKTELLLGGTWTLNYTIISAFSNRYSFTTVQASTGVPGDYNAFGTDDFGDPIIGGYVSQSKAWAILDPGVIIDRFFVFTFSDNNHVSGCYYQINPPGSTNIGSCYSMSGSRFPQKSMEAAAQLSREREALEGLLTQGPAGSSDPDHVELYLRIKSLLKQR